MHPVIEDLLGKDDVIPNVRSGKETATSLVAAAREFFKNRSPRFILATVLSLIGYRLYLGDWSLWDAAIVGGILAFWPIQEWLIHVFILHFKPFKIGERTVDLHLARKHRRHHGDPWNLSDIFVPLYASILAMLVQVTLWTLLMPTRSLAVTGIAFFSFMGLVYEWTHYLVHSRYRPRSAFYKRIWKHHRLHHCKNEHYWFGVTMSGGDRLLGTFPDEHDVELSETARTIIA
jgi:hypothetical protein